PPRPHRPTHRPPPPPTRGLSAITHPTGRARPTWRTRWSTSWNLLRRDTLHGGADGSIGTPGWRPTNREPWPPCWGARPDPGVLGQRGGHGGRRAGTSADATPSTSARTAASARPGGDRRTASRGRRGGTRGPTAADLPYPRAHMMPCTSRHPR